jgi:hypothetical protein
MRRWVWAIVAPYPSSETTTSPAETTPDAVFTLPDDQEVTSVRS